jgi:tyrosyl-tRNA synthetase
MEALALESLDPDVKKKYDLVRSVGEECVTDSELRNLVAKKPGFILYDGFEPSGRMHIAQVVCSSFPLAILGPTPSLLQGIFKAMNVNKCTRYHPFLTSIAPS